MDFKLKTQDAVFLRNVLVGLLSVFKNKVKWTNKFESGDKEVIVPFYGKLYGSERFLLDAFVDDIPQDRVELNVDKVPRGILSMKSWRVKSNEMCNPNVWLKTFIETEDENKNKQLTQIIAQTKAIPIQINLEVKAILASDLETLMFWQEFMKALYFYKFFSFQYHFMRIDGVLSVPDDNETVVPFESDMKTDTTMTVTFQMQVDTHFPIFDYDTAQTLNKGVQWTNNMYDEPGVIPPPEQ